jgi:hypothetical protein
MAPLGVRYVVLREDLDDGVQRAFARQVDVRSVQRFRGSQILANEAWLPVAGAVGSQQWIAASSAPPARARDAAASLPEDPQRSGGLRVVRPGLLVGRTAPRTGAVLVAEEFSSRWRAEAGARTIAPRTSFGWATAFPITDRERGSIVVSWRGQGPHRLALIGEAVILLALSAAWSRRAARERGER